jgi:hypothetical protein
MPLPVVAAIEAAQTPDAPVRANEVQLDLGLAVVGLAYERLFGDRFALQTELQVFGTWFGPWFDLPNLSGFGAQLRPSWFPFGGPGGLYVAPFVRIDRVSGSDGGVSGHGVGWSVGEFNGWSFLLGERVDLRVGAGVQYVSYVVDAGTKRLEFRQLFPALDLVVGWRF